jgi:SAM-dependent methyltransferase
MTYNLTSCLLCGKDADLKHDNYPGYRAPDTYRIYHCKHCQTAFSLPRGDASSIYENIYHYAERVPGYNRYFRYTRFIKKFKDPLKFLSESSEVYWGVKEAISRSADKIESLAILEIGSGLGYFTYSLLKAGYNIKGIDISETAVNKANETFGDHFICAGISEYAHENAGKYDIVISTEVIEHIENPLEFVDSILILLKPGGKIILTTPNKSLFPDYAIWASELPPVHSWWFSEDSLKYIARKSGAEVSFINFSEYYRNSCKTVGLKSHQEGKLPTPYFNKEGELLIKSARSKNPIKIQLKVILQNIPKGIEIERFFKRYIKRLTGIIRKSFEKDIIVCGEKGTLLCAIIQKRRDG